MFQLIVTTQHNMAAFDLTIRVRSALYAADVTTLRPVLQAVGTSGRFREDLSLRECLAEFEKLIRDSEQDADDGLALLDSIEVALRDADQETESEPSEPAPGSAPLTGGVTATQVGTVRVEGLRRDFKYSGTIGDGTGDLSYLSLVRQIETGKKKGHSDVELVDAVIRAVKPSCRLRAYVESCDNITLNTLLKVVRSFYQERTPTELYQDLCKLRQQPKESPQDFLFRALALKQKLTGAVVVDGSGTRYDPTLVEQQFKRTLCTGLENDLLRVELERKIDAFLSDEALIEGFSETVRRQVEAQAKRGVVKVKTVEAQGRLAW